ncbi:MAG: hypothetical protein BGP11_13120 [Rhodobacterales bacterium 65-51]|uniref:hypothetical protein n=1 Tax=uncultured Gemmobacter sp. TaxID=1095917 RepID=UPI000961C409|nr:hypothetical protein [uncultured Gemmobacter sp.]OJY26212.1 MAG: hypothetical protein BGP11_13120 [Rhodobacterales bacterium 65-51]
MTDILTALVQALLPHALEILGAVLTVLIGWAADAARRNWGIQIEAKHREALQSALLTGSRMAIQRGLSGHVAAEAAVGYAQSSVPDAIRALRPAPEVITNLARAKLVEAAG